MKTLAIIAEYNPMHLGHIYQLNKAKELVKPDKTILLMSGNFTQNGNISVIDKHTKAKIAIENGFDVVIQLPVIYATSSAEFFSKNAIKILNGLNVDYVSFGAESDFKTLSSIAHKLILNEDEIYLNIKKEPKNQTFATSRANVLKKFLTDAESLELNKPNNILGIEYLKEIEKTGNKITPVIIKRNTDFLSATNIRNKLIKKEEIKDFVPSNTLENINNISNENIYTLLRYKINAMDISHLKDISEITEGLENSFKKHIITATSYNEFISYVKSKRYVESKIKRIILNILFDIKKDEIKNVFAYILAIKDKEFLSYLNKNSNIDIIIKPNEKIHLEIKEDNIYNIITSAVLNKDFTKKL